MTTNPTTLDCAASMPRARTHNRGLCFLVDIPRIDDVPGLGFDRCLIAEVADLVKRYR